VIPNPLEINYADCKQSFYIL